MKKTAAEQWQGELDDARRAGHADGYRTGYTAGHHAALDQVKATAKLVGRAKAFDSVWRFHWGELRRWAEHRGTNTPPEFSVTVEVDDGD